MMQLGFDYLQICLLTLFKIPTAIVNGWNECLMKFSVLLLVIQCSDPQQIGCKIRILNLPDSFQFRHGILRQSQTYAAQSFYSE